VKFADTSWWVAWSLPGDARHHDALAVLAGLGGAEQMLSTNHVVGEAWTFLRRKDSHATALAFIDRIAALQQAGRLSIHRVTVQQEEGAWTWLRRHDERRYSFVDASSFQVMRDRRLREALAFNGDFSAAGFIELRPL
jgi:predicted nucleic acid-binding protein